MDRNQTPLDGLTRRRPRSILRERIAHGAPHGASGASALDVTTDDVVLDLQELARRRLG